MNIRCSQKLDDGDTALIEEYRDVTQYDAPNVIEEYYKRAFSHSYVVSVSIEITP
jgi:hypothetical protein